MMESNRIVSTLEKNYIARLLKEGKRLDGRGLFDFRDISIETNFVPKSEGSADVKIGDTRVMVGVKYEIGQPFPDNPDEGVCTVMSEFVPVASPFFESGPPNEDSIQLARVVDRGIRHSNCIDYKKLCIKEGEYVYVLYVDCYVMDHYGNLIDTSALGAITALLSAKLPHARLNEEGKPEWDGTYFHVPINEIPLSITFAKIDNYIFVDPSINEELVMDGAISFAVNESGKIASIQKFGTAVWTIEEVLECSRKAIKIADQLREKLNLRQYLPPLEG